MLPFINLTGGIRVLLDYANWLHAAGHDVTVVYPTWPYRFQYTRKQQWGEFQKHRANPGRVSWFELRCRLLRVPLVRAPFLPRADVVVASAWPTVHDVAALPPSKGRKVQIVFHHESGTGAEDTIRATYALPFYRIAFSRFVRDDVHSRFNCDVQAVVPNGVDRALFFPDGTADQHDVLFLYHPDPRKGAADGVAALARLIERRPNLRVAVCGTVRPESWPERLPFEFHPDDDTLRRRYSGARLFLYPSRYEGFGLPPLEAMACGCPPITTDVGAVPEYAVDRGNALVVPVGDVAAMVDRMHELLGDDDLRSRMSASGLETADRYALTRVASLFADALAAAIRDQRSGIGDRGSGTEGS